MNTPITPSHYQGDFALKVIERFRLGFNLGNAIKYILRHENKAGIEDLKKARFYINREITLRDLDPDSLDAKELIGIIIRCQAPDADEFERQILALLTKMGCVHGF